MAEYIEYHPLKFWLDPASIAEIVAHIQTYLVNNPINSTTEIETIIHDYLIAHPELIGGVESVNGQTGEVVLTADNISAGENVTIKDVLDSLQDQINDIVISIPSDYQQLINDVSNLKSEIVNNYGDSQGVFHRGSLNTTTGEITFDPSMRIRLMTGLVKKGLFKYVISNSPIYVYVAYYNSNSTDSYVKAVGWKTGSYELENYPYIAILAKNGNAGTDTFSSTEIPVYISQYSSVPSIAKIAEDLADVTEDLADVSADVAVDEAMANNFLYQSSSYVNRATSGMDYSLANTKRWFLDLKIPANTFVMDFKYWLQIKRIATALTVELWRLNNGTLTKFKSVTATDFVAEATNTVVLNTFCDEQTMVGILCTSSVNYTADAGVHVFKADDNSASTTSLSLSAVTDFGDYSPNVTVDVITLKGRSGFTLPGNVVTVGAGMDYAQIQEALDSITDDSVSKPYTILVMPSGTPYQRFSMLRDFNETYPWNSISPRYVSIIGVDRKHCIIQSDSGDYKLPCGEPMTNGMIKNLTFIMTNDDQDPNATQGGYCLHIDCRTLDDVGYNMVIEDCDFEDASAPCLGIGMHKNCALTIRRCNFKTTLSANYSPHEGYTNLYNYGVIFCHSSTRSDATNQRINIEDCFGICAEGNKSLWLSVAGDYSPSTASFYYRLLRNVFWNETQNAPAYSISNTLTAEPMNFGNNIPT